MIVTFISKNVMIATIITNESGAEARERPVRQQQAAPPAARQALAGRGGSARRAGRPDATSPCTDRDE
jgi:hypothetical protein